MLAVRLEGELEARLENLSKKTGRTKSYYVKKALDKYLEDQEDYLLAVSRLEEKNPRVSLEEVIKKIGLENWAW